MRSVILPSILLGIGCAASYVLGTSSCGALHRCVQNSVLTLLSKHWQKPENRGFYLKWCYKSHFSWCRAGLCTATYMLFRILVFLVCSQTAVLTPYSLACQMLQIQGKYGVTSFLCRTYSWPAWDLLFGLTLNLDFLVTHQLWWQNMRLRTHCCQQDWCWRCDLIP